MTTLFGSSRKNRLDENGFPIDEEVASPIGSLRNLFRTGSGSMQPKQLKSNEEEEAVSASRSKLMAHKGGVFGGQRIEQVQTNLVQTDVVSDEEEQEEDLLAASMHQATASATALGRLGFKLGDGVRRVMGKTNKGLDARLGKMGATGKVTKQGLDEVKNFANAGLKAAEMTNALVGTNAAGYYLNRTKDLMGRRDVLTEEMLEELATKIENASKPRPEVTQKMHDIGAAQRSGECKNLKPVMANQQAINRAFKSSIKMHLFHAQQSERKRRFSFSETDAGSAVQAALAQTYLHMMDPKNNELSKEIKNTREEVEWALDKDDYDTEKLKVYKFNKPGRQFVKWSQPQLDPRLSYLVENTAEVLHKNITVRDRTVRAAAEQHMNNEGRSWRSLVHTERLKNGVFGADIQSARSNYYEKVLMCSKEEGQSDDDVASEISRFTDAEEQLGELDAQAESAVVSDGGVSSTLSALKLSPQLVGTAAEGEDSGWDTGAEGMEGHPLATEDESPSILSVDEVAEAASVLYDHHLDASQLLDAPLEDVGTVMSILDSENQEAGSDLARVLNDQSTVGGGSEMSVAPSSMRSLGQSRLGPHQLGQQPSDGRLLKRGARN